MLKDLYDLSYDETAFWIQDRLSFQRFVGWSPPGRCIVDSEVLRLFVEFLHWQGVIHPLFDRFHSGTGPPGDEGHSHQPVLNGRRSPA